MIDSNPTTPGEAAPEAIEESTLEKEIESPASEPEDSPGKPLSITVQIDSNHAEQALIPMEGGEISTTSPDGTQYTLTIPAGALISPQLVSITPIKSIDIFGEFTSGVLLAPEGLILIKPARLSVELAGEFLPDDMTPFAYSQGGQNFHHYPLADAPTSSSYQLNVYQFGGLGAGSGGPGDSTPVDTRLDPCSAEANLDENLSAILNAAAQRASSNGGQVEYTSEEENEINRLLVTHYEDVVMMLIDRAGQGGADLHCAITSYTNWVGRARTILPSENTSSLSSDGMGDLSEAVRKSITHAEKICRDENDPNQALKITSYLGLLQLLGGEEGTTDIVSELGDCLQFKLDFQSAIYYDDRGALFGQSSGEGDRNTAELSVQAEKVPLTLKIEQGQLYLSGSGVLEYLGADWESDQCTVTTTRMDNSVLEVKYLFINLNIKDEPCRLECYAAEENDRQAEEPDPINEETLVMLFNPGVPLEQIHRTCGDDYDVEFPLQWWWTGFLSAHCSEIGFPETLEEGAQCSEEYIQQVYDQAQSPDNIYFMVDSWQMEYGDLYAQKTYERTISDGEYTPEWEEVSHLQLWHTPKP